MQKIRLLSFDLDDTLWPCRPTIEAAESKLYQWLEDNVPEIAKTFTIDQTRKLRAEYIDAHPEHAHDLSLVRVESLKQLAKLCDIEDDWVADAFDVYFNERQNVDLYDDVVVLDRLAEVYRLIAVTNGNADIEMTGVSHWFEFCISASSVGAKKPHVEFFESVLEQTDLPPGEIIHVGDEPHYDIYGASQIGINTVWLNRDRVEWQHDACRPDYSINNLFELPDLLSNLGSGGRSDTI